MNAAVKTIKYRSTIGIGALKFVWIKQHIIQCVIWAFIFMSALGIIYITNETRWYYATLQAQQNERQRLHVEWSQLLLERGAWMSSARIEDVATQYLNMQTPQKIQTVKISETV